MRWFRSTGPLFVPIALPGWLITGAAIAFCAQVFWAIDRQAHSVSDTLYGIYPFWGVTFLGLAWIAGRTGAT